MKLRHTTFIKFIITIFLIVPININGQTIFDKINEENINVIEIQKWAQNYFDNVGRGKGTGYKLYKRWEHFALRKMNADGSLPNEFEFEEAFVEFKRKAKSRGLKSAQANWTELGPNSWTLTSSWSPGQGRIVAIAVEPNEQKLIYACSPGGGIWKSVDAGQSWTPKGDQLSNMSIWSVAIDPSNNDIVYLGNSSGRVLKSTNGGNTWNNTPLETFSSIRTLLINPDNPAIILAACSNGIYRTVNSGASWSRVSASRTEDILFKPNNTAVVYACGRSFQKSTDGGVTWNTISNGFISNDRMKMTVSPAAPDNIWISQAQGNSFGRIYRSTNSGNGFNIIYNGPINLLGQQAGRDMAIAVSPNNANIIHIGGLDYYRSSDGGQSWTTMASWSSPYDPSYVHADIEVMQFVGNNFYVGSDGGIFRSYNEGENMEDLTVNGLAVSQFYQMGNSQTNPLMIAAGAQDNGTMITYGNGEYISWVGADGFEAVINYNNSNRVFTEIQFGGLYYSSNGGQSVQEISSPPGSGQGAWLTPLEMDSENPDVIYQAFADVWKLSNGGWENISSSVNLGNGANGMAMCIAPSDNNYLYVAYPNGVWRTKNAQANTPTWTRVDGHGGSVNYIHVNPNNPEHVAIATTGSSVYESRNAGDSWQNITSNLPRSGAMCVLFDGTSKNGIYVGMNPGVYFKNEDMTEWIDFGQGIPNTQVTELEIQRDVKKLRASTYGRGIWETNMFSSGVSVSIIANGPLKLCDQATVELSTSESFDLLQWKKDGQDLNGANGSVLTVSEPGRYTLYVEKDGKSGESNSIIVENITPEPPVVSDLLQCGPGEVELSAIALQDGILKWYNSNDASTPFDLGNKITTNVNNNTTFYVEQSLSKLSTVGPNTPLSGGGYHNGGYNLIFDAQDDFTLKSVLVFAQGDGNRTFVLYDNQDNLIAEKEVFINDGSSRVDLDLSIKKGVDYKIGVLTQANLYRSNAGVNYPYVIDGIVNIKYSSAGSDAEKFYYYLYDWEIASDGLSQCVSDRSEIYVEVMDKPSTPITQDLKICSPGNIVELSVQGTTEFVSWYADESGEEVLGNGELLTQNIQESKTYFIDQSILPESVFGAAENNQIGTGGMHAGGFYLVFDALKDFLLKSVLVYAEGNGIRKIDLLNSQGEVIQSKSIQIPDGSSRITLEFNVPEGTGYRLGVAENANLYRNSSGPIYPYSVGSLANIISSSIPDSDAFNYYYYFYDWEAISTNEVCRSDLAELNVFVEQCTDVSNINQSNQSAVFPNPTSGIIYLDNMESQSIDKIRVLNAKGQVLKESGFDRIIDISEFESGAYFIEMKGKTFYQVKRLVLDHNE